MNPSDPTPVPTPAAGWRQALALWFDSRLEIIRIEATEARRSAASRASTAAAFAACTLLGWSLLLAAAIGWLPTVTPLTWPATAAILAAIHLAAALLLLRSLRRPQPPSFPVTRQEFQKDREWLSSLQPPTD